MKSRLKRLLSALVDKAYRDAFVEAQIETIIPFQLRAMRAARKWNQKRLAKEAGMAQGRISVLENPNYEGAVNVRTLIKLAHAFDVGLIVRFAPHSEVAEWSTRVRRENHIVPDFETEWDAAQKVNGAYKEAGFAEMKVLSTDSTKTACGTPEYPIAA